MLRNRIRGHRTVRAGELVPHPLNWRTHPAPQRDALKELYDEIGFARSLLAFELPDGRLQLIDGHLRRELTPDAEVTVEVLDVSPEEAHTLLLTMDPLAALAGRDEDALAQLAAVASTESQVLRALFDAVARSAETPRELPDEPADKTGEPALRDQFLVLVTCESEEQQAELIERLSGEGLACKPLTGFGG